jgi:hypothetical protein
MIKSLTQSILVIFVISTFSCRSNETLVKKFTDGVYKGEVDKKGNKHGKGLIIWNDGSSYKGEFKKDLRHGKGLFNWENGESYEGEYTKDERTGIGIYLWPDGSKYEGSFLNGKRHGFGRFQTASGIIYEGQWHEDIAHKIHDVSHTKFGSSVGEKEESKSLPYKPRIPSKTAGESNNIESPKTSKSSYSSKSNSVVLDDEPKISMQIIKKENNYLITQPLAKTTKEAINVSPELPKEEIVAQPVKEFDPPFEFPPQGKEKIINSSPPQNAGGRAEKVSNIWTGTVEEAEELFYSETIGGIDTVKDVGTKNPFTGKMQVINENGSLLGEVNLLNGQLHGEELILDEKGTIVERYFWVKGIETK